LERSATKKEPSIQAFALDRPHESLGEGVAVRASDSAVGCWTRSHDAVNMPSGELGVPEECDVMITIRVSPARRMTALAFVLGLASPARAQVFDYELQGSNSSEYFGYAVNRIGDLDGDGCEDYVVGALGASIVYPSDGEAIVYSGIDGAVLATLSGNIYSELGTDVDGKIDSDGDGYPDVIIGAPQDALGNGRVVVFSPHLNTILLDLYGANGEEFGWSVRSVQDDLDGDGVNDFIVGAPYADKTYVYSGATGALIYSKHGQAGANSGWAVSNAGDMNGDGVHDFLIGAPSYVDSGGKMTGRVTAFSGKDGSQLWATNGADGSIFGWALAHPGDLDGDGLGDCIVGAPLHDDPSGVMTGAVIALSGASGAALYKVYGDLSGETFGQAVQGMNGDVDQDGTKDFIAGAPGLAGSGYVGYARLFSGATGSVLFTYNEQTSDPTLESYYGIGVAGGDINGDGRPDVIIGGEGFNSSAGIVETWTTSVASWSNYGSGWSGSQGVPGLFALSNPVVGQTLSVDLLNSAIVPTTGLLLIGVSSASIPTNKGGTLLVDPLLLVPVSIPSGGLTLTASIPDDPSLYGFNLYLQGLEIDSGASKGISFTPGLDLLFGFA
jgi:hypothetical protein